MTDYFEKILGGFSGNILLCLIRFIRFGFLQTSNETMLQSFFFNRTSTLPLTKK